MRLLVDAQLPPVLADWLAKQGHQAEHVFDHLKPTAEDDEVWALAVKLNAALVTKDEDFITIRTRSAAGPAIVWLRIGNATNPALVAWLQPRLNNILCAIDDGAFIVEVR